MLIQYYLADGSEITYTTSMDMPTVDDVSNIALMYSQKRQNCLPEFIFISSRIYGGFISSIGGYMGPVHGPAPHIVSIHTSVGLLTVKIMPWATDTKLFLIGNMDDFERYDVDKIFEDIVLKDCEREGG
jgi:hypothetical protein